jgi:ankyrin repeat protein
VTFVRTFVVFVFNHEVHKGRTKNTKAASSGPRPGFLKSRPQCRMVRQTGPGGPDVKSWRSALLAGLLATTALGYAAEAAEGASLIAAAKADDREAALAALAAGQDPNAAEADGSSALLYAVYNIDPELARALLDSGADPNRANDYGATPLMEAATAGQTELVRMLLDAGADPMTSNGEGMTALMAAARSGVVETARILIDAGADVNAREAWGEQTALMWAAAQHHPDMIDLLVAAGADVNAQAPARNWERLVTTEPRIKEMLSGGLTPLLYAAREGCAECVRRLAAAGADLDLPDPDGVTPLLAALLNLRFDAAAALIEEGADVQQWDWWGRTPLYQAIDTNQAPQGGRRDLPSTDQHTGLDIARMLLERGADVNFQLKLEPPQRNVVFDRDADNRVLTTGATPLLRAAWSSEAAAIALLLEHGADVELPNKHGITPIMAAGGLASSDRPTRGRNRTQTQVIESVDLLLAAGADINKADETGETVIHGASRIGWTDVVRHLAANGANVNAVDDEGRTPWVYASGKVDRQAFFATPDPGIPRPETMAALEELGAIRTADAAESESPSE